MGLEVFNPFAGLLGEKQQQDSWRWGTVVSGSPVRVRLDGDSEASLATPDCLVSVTVGDRVRVQISNRRMTVFGKLYAGSQGDPGGIVINGTAYATSGSVTAPEVSWSSTVNSVSYGHLNAPIPYNPPAGYTFIWTIQEVNAWTFIANKDRFPSGGTHALRVIQIANTYTDRITRLQWQLVRA